MKQLSLIKIFESLIWHSRYILILAVAFGILGAIMLVLLGCNEILMALTHIFDLVTKLQVTNELEHAIVANIVTAIDTYLIATVLLIFSIGIYELFIKRLDKLVNKEHTHNVLCVHNLEQLKEKLAKVIIMVLIVTFFKFVVEIEFNNMVDLLYLSIGIFLISLAVFFTHTNQGTLQRKQSHKRESAPSLQERES